MLTILIVKICTYLACSVDDALGVVIELMADSFFSCGCQ